MFRTGIGFDAHALLEGRPLVIGGVRIPHSKGLLGHSDAEQPITPCGTCRQFMLEFAPLKVTMANLGGKTKTTTANKLLPLKFERRKKQ